LILAWEVKAKRAPTGVPRGHRLPVRSMVFPGRGTGRTSGARRVPWARGADLLSSQGFVNFSKPIPIVPRVPIAIAALRREEGGVKCWLRQVTTYSAVNMFTILALFEPCNPLTFKAIGETGFFSK
jgi:hypothetical protein